MRQSQIKLILVESIGDNKVEAVCDVLDGVLRIGQILYAPNTPKVISISRTPGGRNLETAVRSAENYIVGIEGDTTLVEGKNYNTYDYGKGEPVFKKAYSH